MEIDPPTWVLRRDVSGVLCRDRFSLRLSRTGYVMEELLEFQLVSVWFWIGFSLNIEEAPTLGLANMFGP